MREGGVGGIGYENVGIIKLQSIIKCMFRGSAYSIETDKDMINKS